MKVALLGDSHFGHSKSSDIFHNYFAKFFEFFFNTLEEQGISVIIQTGDMFDYRREVHFNTIYRSREYFFSKLDGRQLIVISGNHDCVFKNTNRINSVRLLVDDIATVVDMVPTTLQFGDECIDFYPWINPENLEESVAYAKKSKSRYAVGHFEFEQFPLHPGTIADHGMSHKLFSNYEQVISGHYHTQSQRDNIHYIGTPYELTWVDCNDPKGFWILDTETGVKEFYRNPHSLFKKVEYTDGMKFDFSEITGKYTRIIVGEKESQKKFDEFVHQANMSNPLDLKIIEASVADAVSEALNTTVTMVSTQCVIEAVIESLDVPNLDKSILKQKVMAKYSEALSISNQL